MLIEAKDGTPATPETVKRWNDELGLSYTVVAAPGGLASRYFVTGPEGIGLPAIKTLKPGVVVEEALIQAISEAQIQSILP